MPADLRPAMHTTCAGMAITLLHLLVPSQLAQSCDPLAPGDSYYVDSSRGNDSFVGSKAAPFRSLVRARDAARASTAPTRRVHLSGVFEQHETLHFDTNQDGCVSWIGEVGATISGAASLKTESSDWRPHAEAPGVYELLLPPELSARLDAAELLDNVSHAHLWIDGRRAPQVRTDTMIWDQPLGTAATKYNSFCELYGDFKLIPECYGFKFQAGSIPADWDVRPSALKKWRVKAYHAWCASFHTVAAVDMTTQTIMFSNPAENPFGGQEGSGGKRWLIEGADDIHLREGSGQWRLKDATLQYAPLARTLDDDYEPAAPVGHACRMNRTTDSKCDSVCCTGDCPGAVGQYNLTTCLQACEDAPQCRFATFWSPPHGPYCYLQRSCDSSYEHPDGNIVQAYRKRRTAPQRRLQQHQMVPGNLTLQWPLLRTVVAVGRLAHNVSFHNLSFAFSRDSCALSPGGCSNVGRDGAGVTQSLVWTAGVGTTFVGVDFVGAGNAALTVHEAANVSISRSSLSNCGGNCVESTNSDYFQITQTWIRKYGTSYPSASGIRLDGGIEATVANCDISDGYSAAIMAAAAWDRGGGITINANRLHNVRPQADLDGVSDSVCGVYASTFNATKISYFTNNHVYDIASWSGVH
eukprot:SAG31_NODE_401_length_16206_cov_10.920780_5_plen_639_part_00